MSKTKTILAIGMILLFVGVTVSPATASISVDKEGVVEDCEKFLPELLDAMEKASSKEELINIIESFIGEWGRHPFLILLLQIIRGVLTLGNNINSLRPVRKDAFVISYGVTTKYCPFKDDKIQLYRPLTTWYYSGRSNIVLNSRTLIIDFHPFKIVSLTGKQCGLMSNFAGIYSHRERTFTGNSFTFFMGKAGAIRGFDLSLFNTAFL